MTKDKLTQQLQKSLGSGESQGDIVSNRYPNIAEIIYKSFQKDLKPREPQDNVTFAPSYLSSCKRQIAYKKLGYEPSNPIDLPQLLKMHWGNLIHEDIQRILKEQGYLISAEIAKGIEYSGLEFNYFYDGIVEYENEQYLLEIKTVYASGYKSIEDAPKDEHVLQALAYCKFENIDKAIILYAGRDNGYLKQHYLYLDGDVLNINGYDTDYVEQFGAKVGDLHHLKAIIERRELPERDFEITLKNNNGVITESFQKDNKKYASDWHCSYCSFKDLCWAKEYEQIKNHKFYINGEFI